MRAILLAFAILAGCGDKDGDGVSAPRDCDDGDAASFPGADELCDGVDNDCDGFLDDLPIDPTDWHRDRDGDGSGNPTTSYLACLAPPGWIADGSDCDDADAARSPAGSEICDALDNDCDGEVDEGVGTAFHADWDHDGFGNPTALYVACAAPGGWILDGTDCDDTDADAFPGGTETCDGVDDDCDGTIDEGLTTTWHPDRDQDGFGSDSQSFDGCAAPQGWILDDSDCNDASEVDFPGNVEVCDGLDNDCDAVADNGVTHDYFADADGDAYGDASHDITACSRPPGYVTDATDCNDGDFDVWPGAYDDCDGIDNDCNGILDDNGYDSDGDGVDNCNDATVYSETFGTCVGNSGNWNPYGWGVIEFESMDCCDAIATLDLPVVGVPNDDEQWSWCSGILSSGNVSEGHSLAIGPDHGQLNNFTVRAMVGAGGVNVDAVGIALNVTGPGDFFLVRWDDPNNAYNRATSLEFIRCVNGQCAMLDRVSPVSTAGTGYTPFEVQVRYDNIDVYVNGVRQMSTITNGGDIGPGRVGVYAFDADTGSRVDSIEVLQP